MQLRNFYTYFAMHRYKSKNIIGTFLKIASQPQYQYPITKKIYLLKNDQNLEKSQERKHFRINFKYV